MGASEHFYKETDLNEIRRIHALQEANKLKVANSSYKDRRRKLDLLHDAVLRYRSEISDAVYKDCRRHRAEVDMTETYPVISELKHAKRNLRKWMKDKKVSTPLPLMGSSSYVKYEPKGHVLIISPWNFPVNLCLVPLISAVCAGNVVTIKPSEYSPFTTELVKKIIEECFDEKEVSVIQGGVDTAVNILKQRFNHIFFTGSSKVGKKVMQAASEYLCSVTLELGGKSPTIVDAKADIDTAAKRIVWAKSVNNGQICIAPDFVIVHESKKDELCSKMAFYLDQFYGSDKQEVNDYGRIINNNHFHRVKSYLDDALESGARIVSGGKHDEDDNYIEPTILDNVSIDSTIMKQEIFGPVLPVLSYETNQELLDFINSREKPLALYIYSRDMKFVDLVLNNTRAGGTCINHNSVHFYNNNLPFGGSNYSGIGKSHSFAGFKEFSNERAVYQQHFKGPLELLMPPYNGLKQRLIDITIKYF